MVSRAYEAIKWLKYVNSRMGIPLSGGTFSVDTSYLVHFYEGVLRMIICELSARWMQVPILSLEYRTLSSLPKASNTKKFTKKTPVLSRTDITSLCPYYYQPHRTWRRRQDTGSNFASIVSFFTLKPLRVRPSKDKESVSP